MDHIHNQDHTTHTTHLNGSDFHGHDLHHGHDFSGYSFHGHDFHGHDLHSQLGIEHDSHTHHNQLVGHENHHGIGTGEGHIMGHKAHVMSHARSFEVHGGHINLGDNHNTTIDVNPTGIDLNSGTVCGHLGINTHPSTTFPSLNTNIGIDGCVTTHNGGLSVVGNPSVSVGFGFNF